MSDSLVAIEGVTKRYGDILAVDGVSLSLLGSEVYSLVGANGAGKSTLLRMLVGIAEPDSGRVLICDEDLANRSVAARRHLGYLPEELILYDRLTGLEYLELVAGLKEADPSGIAEEVDFFELTRFQQKLVGGYSLGMRKKLGLAAAMLGKAEVVVLDEPLNGLDVEMMRKLRHRIEAEKTNGRALMVASHVMSFVERISDRVGVMRAGKLVAEGSPGELRAIAKMKDVPFEDVFFHFAS